MAELTWSPDGEKMFEKLMEAVPEAMREMLKPKLMEILAARAAGKPATSDTVVRMVREDLPEPQKSVLIQALSLEKPGGKVPSANSDSSDQWTGKSQTMFKIMLNEVPEAMREVFREKLLGVICQKAQGNPFSEDHVISVVHEIVPEPFKSSILKKFNELGDFDPEIIDKTIARHGTTQDSLMYILHDIQDKIGYLPVEALSAVSNRCDINLSTIYNIVTFYKSFKLHPQGKHHIKQCCGTSCHLKDTNNLSQEIEKVVSGPSDTTLEKTLCLGCCDCAPVVEIDGRIYNGEEAKVKINSL